MRCRWIDGVESDLSMSFRLLTGGCGLHTVHKCIVFYRFLCFYVLASLYWVIVCYVRVVYVHTAELDSIKDRLRAELEPT